jgi:hypothetical protein
MILRRVMEHVKAQNWTAVAIDFVIVVLGVFIGIQLGNWNDVLRETVKERATIERLLTDFKLQEDLLQARVARAERLTRASGELLAIVRRGEEPDDREKIRSLIFDCLNTTFREAPPASYSELLASGALSKLNSLPLRESLVRYGQVNARWDYLAGQATAQKDESSKFRQAISIEIDTERFDKGDWSVSASSIKDYDWEVLKHAATSISIVQQHHWEQLDLHQKDLQAVRAVLQELEKS